VLHILLADRLVALNLLFVDKSTNPARIAAIEEEQNLKSKLPVYKIKKQALSLLPCSCACSF
jgi:hypothetical protein